ncbi:MAG: TonB family protein [Sinobacterium sp.]|nr:TonB family protein [Sinobacterium sp.]
MNSASLRLFLGASIAFVVTTALLLLMDALIHGKDVELERDKNQKIADIFMGDTDIDVQRKEQKPEKPEPADALPPEVKIEYLQDAQVNADALNIQPSLKADFSMGGPGLSASDGEYLPFVKVQPPYPRRAQSRGVEGYCIVSYTVTQQGTTKDVAVVDCSSRLFERASTQAALKFKYKPRVVDGTPVEVPNVKNKFNFKLQ